jgi:hypothetical protein
VRLNETHLDGVDSTRKCRLNVKDAKDDAHLNVPNEGSPVHTLVYVGHEPLSASWEPTDPGEPNAAVQTQTEKSPTNKRANTRQQAVTTSCTARHAPRSLDVPAIAATPTIAL